MRHVHGFDQGSRGDEGGEAGPHEMRPLLKTKAKPWILDLTGCPRMTGRGRCVEDGRRGDVEDDRGREKKGKTKALAPRRVSDRHNVLPYTPVFGTIILDTCLRRPWRGLSGSGGPIHLVALLKCQVLRSISNFRPSWCDFSYSTEGVRPDSTREVSQGGFSCIKPSTSRSIIRTIRM